MITPTTATPSSREDRLDDNTLSLLYDHPVSSSDQWLIDENLQRASGGDPVMYEPVGLAAAQHTLCQVFTDLLLTKCRWIVRGSVVCRGLQEVMA
jgi:hypothetical protein